MKESLWSKTLGAYTVHIVPDDDSENPYTAEEWGKKGCKTVNQHLIAKAKK